MPPLSTANSHWRSTESADTSMLRLANSKDVSNDNDDPCTVDEQRRNTITTHVPRLHPVALQPSRVRGTSRLLEFLANIARIEIHDTRVRDGVTYYTLETYRHHFDTHLPTRLSDLRQRASVHSKACGSTTTAATSPSSRDAPETSDFQVERRFSDFTQLRTQVYELACRDPHYRCSFCNEFVVHVRFASRQPRGLAKVVSTTRQRQRLLADFIYDLVRLTVSCWPRRNRACWSHDMIPALLASFVREDFEVSHNDSSSSSIRRSL